VNIAIWVYIRSEKDLWTVGFYDPTDKWHPDSDYASPTEAAKRVHWLNGGDSGFDP
jgi:hypothetical protein